MHQTFTSNKILTVSELTVAIKLTLEKKFTFLAIKGEISNFKCQSSGHMYFSLKDEGSQISCVLFKKNASCLEKKPKEGDEVIVEAELSVYLPRGNYQLIVRKISFVGIGDLLLKLHELKQALQKKGFFDPIYKKKLPFFPKKIGIVTSPTGSVIQDILNVLKRRFSNFHLILNPVKVQGNQAALEIAQAIDDFNKYNLVDVIIIGRGGGTLEDLWAFNEEIVAKSIFSSKIPIISAVGHETDISISDFVADVRAPTPSAAAEIVIKEKKYFLDKLENFEKQILKHIIFHKENLKIQLNNYKLHPFFSTPYTIIGKQMQMLDDINNSINISIKSNFFKQKDFLNLFSNQLKSLNPKNKIKELKNELFIANKSLIFTWKNSLNIKKERLEKLNDHINSIDPKNLLKKGYSILFKDSRIVHSINDLMKNDQISALLSDGKIYATIGEKQ